MGHGTLTRGRLCTVDLLIEIACFVKSKLCLQFKKQLKLTSYYLASVPKFVSVTQVKSQLNKYYEEVNRTEPYPYSKVSLVGLKNLAPLRGVEGVINKLPPAKKL